jgi:hypothetical protein
MPIRIEISRVLLEPGAIVAQREAAGPELMSVESGSVAVVLNPGHLHVTRAGGNQEFVEAGAFDPAAQPTLDPNDPEDAEEIEAREMHPGAEIPGTAVGLADGDTGLLEMGGNRILQGTSDQPAAVVVVAIIPDTTSSATPAA